MSKDLIIHVDTGVITEKINELLDGGFIHIVDGNYVYVSKEHKNQYQSVVEYYDPNSIANLEKLEHIIELKKAIDAGHREITVTHKMGDGNRWYEFLTYLHHHGYNLHSEIMQQIPNSIEHNVVSLFRRNG